MRLHQRSERALMVDIASRLTFQRRSRRNALIALGALRKRRADELEALHAVAARESSRLAAR
jgi:hypothetical protein